MSRFTPNKFSKKMTPPFHICLLYEGEYEDPYNQFVRCFDEEVLSRFPSFLHWLIVWWYNRTHVQNIIPLLEGSRVDKHKQHLFHDEGSYERSQADNTTKLILMTFRAFFMLGKIKKS